MHRERRRFGIVPILFVLALGACAMPVLAAGSAAAADPKPPATSGSAAEAGGAGTWEFGPYFFFSHHDLASTIGNTKGLGLRVGYRFTPVHELEVEYDKGKANSLTLPDTKVDVTKITVNYSRNYNPKAHEKLTPVLIAGTGVLMADNGTHSSTYGLLRVGGGVRFRFSPHVGMRFEGSALSWYGDKQVTAVTRLYTFDANLGVSFFLGGKKK